MTLVSAIMPTRGRQVFAKLALECFLSQTHKVKELVVVDDADDPSFPDGIDHKLVQYHLITEKLNIPEKRNLCIQLARGETIVHFDSDDWSAPGRMAAQVKDLKDGVGLTGFHSMPFYEEETGQAWWYQGRRNYIVGTTFCYLKSTWRRVRFAVNVPLGSDNKFIYKILEKTELPPFECRGLMVARIHSGNANHKDTGGENFKKIKLESLPKDFLESCLTTTH